MSTDDHRSSRREGRLLLVGAGPGDPELLTLRAVRALREADVVLVDDLVDRRVLEHVRAGTRIVHVGKRGGCRSTPQRYIERLIVREALSGRTVVRLKGGDPLVFGRGGEEIEAARRAGVRCEIVSGVTAAVAAAASAGFALTHRACSQGVVFVTGHAAGEDVDWRALAATRMTLAIYMGVARVTSIAVALQDAGMDARTPVAIVERASSAGERVTLATLSALAATVARRRIASPAIVVVGETVARGAVSAVTVARAAVA